MRPSAEATDHVDAVDAGQAEVEHDDIGMVARRDVEGTFTIRREVDLVAAGAQVDAQRAQDLRLVVDDEHTAHRNASRLTTIVRPPPGVSSTVISPPIASTNPRATARPRPVPVPFDWSPSRWNGWNTRSR